MKTRSNQKLTSEYLYCKYLYIDRYDCRYFILVWNHLDIYQNILGNSKMPSKTNRNSELSITVSISV